MRIASPAPTGRRRRRSGGDLADDGQFDRHRRQVVGTHRVAVDRTVVERRHLFGGDHLGGQHQPARITAIGLDRCERAARIPHQRLSGVQRRHDPNRNLAGGDFPAACIPRRRVHRAVAAVASRRRRDPARCAGRTRAGRPPARSDTRRSRTWSGCRRRGRSASSCCSVTSTNRICGSAPTAAAAGVNSTAPIVPTSTGASTSTSTAHRSPRPCRSAASSWRRAIRWRCTVAHIDVETLGVTPVEHVYVRTALRRWRHIDESGVSTEFDVDEFGLVRDLPGPVPPPLTVDRARSASDPDVTGGDRRGRRGAGR